MNPGQVLNLKNWYLTLPIGEVKDPKDVYQPALDSYSHTKHFYVLSADNSNAVVFTAHAGGVTTKNTKNPRCELREMNGKNKAKWSTKTGKHEMIFTEKVVALPKGRPSVVIGQIHQGSDDLIELRCWIPKNAKTPVIDVFHDSTNYGLLDSDYTLGEEYTIKVFVSDKMIQVFYNDMTTPKLKIPASCDTCFFKAGCYTQANTSMTGVLPAAYGEVLMSALEVSHTP